MNKLDGIKAGDRVRVTFEGVFQPKEKSPFGTRISMDGTAGDTGWWASDNEINAPTFTIEKIEPPIAVGDIVRWNPMTDRTGEVIKIHGPKAWIFEDYFNGDVRVYDLSDLERV